jgi:hypothetical protein
VVLDEVARHHRIWHGSGEQLVDEYLDRLRAEDPNRGNLCRFARQQSGDPLAIAGWSIARDAIPRPRRR